MGQFCLRFSFSIAHIERELQWFEELTIIKMSLQRIETVYFVYKMYSSTGKMLLFFLLIGLESIDFEKKT